jgi:hypothetical protein
MRTGRCEWTPGLSPALTSLVYRPFLRRYLRLIIPQQIDGNPRQYWDAAWVTASLQSNVAHFARKLNAGAGITIQASTFTNGYAARNQGLRQWHKLASLTERSGERRYRT